MTQTDRSQTTVLEQLPEPLPVIESAPQQQPELAYADDLMDEIFGEVEQVLDGSLIPPDEPVQVMPEKADIQFDIVAALAERYPKLAQQLEEAEAPDLPGPDTALAKASITSTPTTQPVTGLSLFERMMIFTGCASAVAALAVWLVSQGLISRGMNYLSRKFTPSPQGTTTIATAPPVNSVDVQFSEYMLRSLAAIDRDTPVNPQTVAIAPSTTTPTSPTAVSSLALPPPASTTLQLSPSLPTTSTPTKTVTKATKPTQKVAIAPSNQTDVVTRTEMNQVMNRIVTMLERMAPGISNRLPLPTKSTTGSPQASRVAAAIQPAPSANSPKRRISGIVEWGDKSVVTIEHNGVTQRVYLGESVGSSGWTLVDVKGNQATFRKNGEFRTLADGDTL
jgi:hypothetical protein